MEAPILAALILLILAFILPLIPPATPIPRPILIPVPSPPCALEISAPIPELPGMKKCLLCCKQNLVVNLLLLGGMLAGERGILNLLSHMMRVNSNSKYIQQLNILRCKFSFSVVLAQSLLQPIASAHACCMWSIGFSPSIASALSA
ncbi:hypothetical protein BDQ17DRAFT_1325993 [Cyathus striatus]|nr:hypothetical protein BDQ17DRAFT_1325993 [Cyathus striatus]